MAKTKWHAANNVAKISAGMFFLVHGKHDECQTRRDGQQEDDPCAGISSIVQYPSDVII